MIYVDFTLSCWFQSDKPKATLRIDELNMTIVPQKVDHHNGFQITFEKDGGTRNLFGYAEEGEVRLFALFVCVCVCVCVCVRTCVSACLPDM